MSETTFSLSSIIFNNLGITISDSILQLFFTTFFIYLTSWVIVANWTNTKLRLYIPFWFSVILILFSSSITGTLINDTLTNNAYFCGGIGGLLLFGITLLSGTNNLWSLVLTGSSILISLFYVNNWDYTNQNLQSMSIVVTSIFTIAYILCTPSK